MYSHRHVCVFYTFTVKTEQQSNVCQRNAGVVDYSECQKVKHLGQTEHSNRKQGSRITSAQSLTGKYLQADGGVKMCCSSSFEEGNRRCYGLSTQRLASVAENNREQQRRTTAHQTTVQQQVNQTWSGWTDVAAKNKTGLQTVKQTGGSPNMFRKISPVVMVWNTTSQQKTSKTQHCQIDLCIDSQHILS